MNRIIKTIKLLLALFNLWRPVKKEIPRAKNEPPRPVDTPDDLIDKL